MVFIEKVHWKKFIEHRFFIKKNGKEVNYHIYMDSILFVLTRKDFLRWMFEEKLHPSAQIQIGPQGKWQTLMDTAEWALFYNHSSINTGWSLLSKQGGNPPAFKQKGVYSTKQICFFLREGLCSSRDFIWKKGFKEWKRISLVTDFSTHPIHTMGDILARQMQKYKPQKAQIVRYSPSGTTPDWFELKKTVQDFYI